MYDVTAIDTSGDGYTVALPRGVRLDDLRALRADYAEDEAGIDHATALESAHQRRGAVSYDVAAWRVARGAAVGGPVTRGRPKAAREAARARAYVRGFGGGR